MKLPVGPLGWTPEEHAEFARTGKLPERAVEATSDPIRERYRLEGELEGRREGREGERSRFAKQGATTQKKEKPWRSYARMLALKIKNRTAPDSAIAATLWKQWFKKPAEWEKKIPDRPPVGTLRRFVPRLREEGTLPPRPDRGQDDRA